MHTTINIIYVPTARKRGAALFDEVWINVLTTLSELAVNVGDVAIKCLEFFLKEGEQTSHPHWYGSIVGGSNTKNS